MNDLVKVTPSHTKRTAFVYIRQSSPAQVEHNRESTARQYALLEKAQELGWAKEQVIVIDEDLGVSGSGFAERSGFARMTAEVALGHAGIVFGLEVSRMRATMLTGIACLISAASPTRWSGIATASIIPHFLTIAWYSD